ncbi:hypothetical protein [Stenotrophomonas sp.]|uniref:hypothetical protein n=1 Tax=Stenotrophomonas sp. TaxID=69392 RepID=UPI00289BC27B|nr:hypothetical protein [Stenotrophomonas sp.]
MVIKRLRRVQPAVTRPRRPLPPLPAQLREQLQDYPDHVERLQLALHGVALAPPSRLSRIEMALWALEDRVGRFLAEAQQELDAARCSGDAERFARAQEAERVMFGLRLRQQWVRDEVFVGFFKALG